MKKAFTLAEIMIVLVIIGILTGILLPIAIQSTPNKNVLKFKNGNANLIRVFGELSTSGEFYKSGDLGMKPDGTLVKDKTYLCETFSEVVNSKTVNCSSFNVTIGAHAHVYIDSAKKQSYFRTPEEAASYVDRRCDEYAKKVGAEIITIDGITYYQAGPNITFGMNLTEISNYTSPGVGDCQEPSKMWSNCADREFVGYGQQPKFPAADGRDPNYKIFCMDVDGIHPNHVALYDCVNECPFGYGIRADGKIFYGQRAQEWLEKNIQDGK